MLDFAERFELPLELEKAVAQIEVRMVRMEDLLSVVAVQVGRCEDAIHQEASTREKAIKTEQEELRGCEDRYRLMIDELALRVHEDYVSRGELDIERERAEAKQLRTLNGALPQVKEQFDASMAQVESQLGDIVGSIEDMCRELRSEEQARADLEDWIVEQVAGIESQLRMDARSRSEAERSPRRREGASSRSPPPVPASTPCRGRRTLPRLESALASGDAPDNEGPSDLAAEPQDAAAAVVYRAGTPPRSEAASPVGQS